MEEHSTQQFIERHAVPIAVVLVLTALIVAQGARGPAQASAKDVRPAEGVTIPIVWGDLGKRLVQAGAIDRERFVALYGGALTNEEALLLDGEDSSELRVTAQNAPYLLNLLWAFGLANKNPILTEGEMADTRYGNTGNFASTGGWTLARGDAMEHYGAHALVTLTASQQALVEEVSQNIYRPCCDNSTHFPDCNHGMAMLGLLELLASQGASKEDMYKAALAVNSFWFPDSYQTIAAYFKEKRGVEWNNVPAKEALGKEYSSGSGYARIAALMQPTSSGGGSCGVQ